MKKFALLILPVLILASCCPAVTVTVTNGTDSDRLPEMVELCSEQISGALDLKDGENFIIRNEAGEEQPYQITSDAKVIFQVEMKAGESGTYTITKGQPSEYQTYACGRHYPERLDDFAWENDLVGFRAYGPALQAKGERGFGYDLFAKRGTDLPVIGKFYELGLGERNRSIYNELKQSDPQAAEDYLIDSMSFHVDHGYGMDAYAVGPNLGAGVTALVDEEILYPWCYKEYEILDNGPLRMSFRLTFAPVTIGQDAEVVETRLITLDAGSYLNRTTVVYENLSQTRELVAGIVLRDKDGKEITDIQKGYIAYPAPTMNFDKHKHVDNGTIYVGNYTPEKVTKTEFRYFSKEESKKRGNSKGHILLHSEYHPGETFTYYWGNGWNHWDIESYEEWIDYLERFSDQHNEPLKIRIK